MKSPTAFRVEAKWSAAEKKIARQAYQAAFLRQCGTITEKAKKMLEHPLHQMGFGGFMTTFPASVKK